MHNRAWLLYTIIRLGVIVVVFGALALLGVSLLVAAAIAVLVATLVSFFGLGRLRGEFSAEIAATRDRRKQHSGDPDATAEDAAAEALSTEPDGQPGELAPDSQIRDQA